MASGTNGNYKLKNNESIIAYGEIGIGIETVDLLNGYGNKCGIYSIELQKGKEIIFKSEMEKFSFDQSRAINSLIDYGLYLKKKIRFQRSFIEPNNHLGIYKQSINDGRVHFSKDDKMDFNYLVKDTYGNTSKISFNVTGDLDKSLISDVLKPKPDTIFSYKDSNYFDDNNLTISIPYDALYKDLPFQYQVADTIKGAISPTYFIHNDFTPLHKPIFVSIKVGRISDYLRSKSTIVQFDAKNRYYSRGGEWRNNFITAKTKSFGGFAVMIDTIAPVIKAVNIYKNKNMLKNSKIIVKIGDNLSGVRSYRGTIDGKWIIMQYEAKKAYLIHKFDNLANGKHIFELTVTDDVGNASTVSIPFIR